MKRPEAYYENLGTKIGILWVALALILVHGPERGVHYLVLMGAALWLVVIAIDVLVGIAELWKQRKDPRS